MTSNAVLTFRCDYGGGMADRDWHNVQWDANTPWIRTVEDDKCAEGWASFSGTAGCPKLAPSTNSEKRKMKEQSAPNGRSMMLVVLCVLTILGNVFLILKGLATYFFLDESSDTRIPEAVVMIDVFFAVELLTCVGAIVGAVMMLAGMRKGLTLYQFSAAIYIMQTLALAVGSLFTIVGIPLAFLQVFYLVPCILFLALFSTKAKYLS